MPVVGEILVSSRAGVVEQLSSPGASELSLWGDCFPLKQKTMEGVSSSPRGPGMIISPPASDSTSPSATWWNLHGAIFLRDTPTSYAGIDVRATASSVSLEIRRVRWPRSDETTMKHTTLDPLNKSQRTPEGPLAEACYKQLPQCEETSRVDPTAGENLQVGGRAATVTRLPAGSSAPEVSKGSQG